MSLFIFKCFYRDWCIDAVLKMCPIVSCKLWLTFFAALLTPGLNIAFDVCPPGASRSPPAMSIPADGARAAAGGVTLNSSRPPDAADRAAGGAIYTQTELMRLRATATEAPPDEVAFLLRRLGLHQRRHRGVRGGRKSHRPIKTIITNRPDRPIEPSRTDSRCLSRPSRLTLAQTRSRMQTDRARAAPGAGRLRVACINAQSLPSKVDLVISLLEREALDILCVAESWLSPEILSRFLIFPGYQVIRRDRVRLPGGPSRGGGVAIILREGMQHRTLDMPEADLIETLWLSVTWPGGRPSVIGVAYRPPAGPVNQAVDQLQEQLQTVLTHGKPVLLLGDININVLNPDSTATRYYNSCLAELGLVQLVRQPTHLHPIPTALDHIITNIDPPPPVKVLDAPIADHQPVLVEAPIGRLRARPTEHTGRNWRAADWDAICLQLLLADWSALQATEDVDEMVNIFMANWNAALDQHCPVRTRRFRRPACPWLSDEDLRLAMAERDEAFAAWRDLRTDDARADYVRLRASVKSMLSRARRDFLSGRLAGSDRRDFWVQLKRLYMTPSAASSAPLPTDERERRAQMDSFNQFFATVGSRIAAELHVGGEADQLSPRPPIVVADAFKLEPITIPELGRVVAVMNGAGAVGGDGVPLSAIRRCMSAVAPYLLRIVNKSLVTSRFPESWRLGTVVPIYKQAGDPGTASNFRPITLLSHLSKIVEKVVSNQLSVYISRTNLLYKRQYAYRRCHSTEDAVLDAVDCIAQNIDSGFVSALIAADLSKAFDSVDHGALLCKLGWYGVDPSWFASYLGGRGQVVRGGSATPVAVSHGVPQGSIIGPILFSLFCNDLPSHLDVEPVIYADDIHLLDRAKPEPQNLIALKARLENTLSIMQNWYRSNSLKMNPQKTEFIMIGSRQNIQKTEDFNIVIDDVSVTPSGSLRMLGVVLDPVLSWEKHVGHVVQKCNCLLISFYRFRHHFSQDVLQKLINTHVFPYITYCLSVWGGASKNQLFRIQKTINFAARVVTGARRTDRIGPTLQALGWERVERLVEMKDAIKLHKLLSSDHQELGPPAVRSMFVARSAVSHRSTRSTEAGRLELPRCRLVCTQRGFRYRAAATWNMLSPTVTNIRSAREFKRAIR